MKIHIFAAPSNFKLPEIGEFIRVDCKSAIPMKTPVEVRMDIHGVIPDGICPKCLKIDALRKHTPLLVRYGIPEETE